MTVRGPDGFRVCFVCTGNICRSPMAEAVFRARAAAEGLAVTVLEPAQVPGTFQQALHEMRSGRPGPVLIDLPLDVHHEAPGTPCHELSAPETRRTPALGSVHRTRTAGGGEVTWGTALAGDADPLVGAWREEIRMLRDLVI
jgi:hypothetical protein